MLTTEQVKKLNEEIIRGKEAEKIVEKYTELKGNIETLEDWIAELDEDYIDQIVYGTHHKNKLLHVSDKEFAIKQLKEIMMHEFKLSLEKLNRLG